MIKLFSKICLVWILLGLMTFSLFSCLETTKGGLGSISREEVIITTYPDGTVEQKKTTTSGTITQPSNSKESGTLQIQDNGQGKVKISADTGSSYDLSEVIGQISLLKIPMYSGIALIIGGIILFALTKNFQWPLIIGGTGVGMTVGSYLLSKYSEYFLFGLLVVLLYIGYIIYDWFRQQKANKDNIKLLELTKRGVVEPENLTEVADVVQDKDTKRIVKKVKESWKGKKI